MRPLPLLLAVLALLALPSHGAAEGLSAVEVTGEGAFTAGLGIATWAAAPPAEAKPIQLSAQHLRLRLVDEVDENRIPHPTKPSEPLLARHRQDRPEREFTDATVRVWAAGDPDGLLVLRTPEAVAGLAGRFTVAAQGEQVIERSHYRPTAVGASDPSKYEILQPAALLLQGDRAAATPQGEAQLYAWGAVIEVAAQGQTWTYRTGAYTEPGAPETSHVAHAWLDLKAPTGTLDAPAARLWSATLELDGAGLLGLRAAGAGPAAVEQLRLDQGSIALGVSGDHVRVLAVEPGAATVAAPTPALPPPWLLVGLTSFLLALPAAGLAPGAYGWYLQRRGRIDALAGGRARRAEAYAAVAARLDVAGYPRLARAMAARAVANQPHVAGHRIELAIHLQRLGRLHAAVQEHEAAHALMAAPSDRNEIALTAFHAAQACARMHRDGAAAWWLGTALRNDPGLEADLGDHPVLARLRRHPHLRMLVN